MVRHSLALMLALGAAPALAQEGEVELAVPVDAPKQGPLALPGPSAPKPAPPGERGAAGTMSPDKLQALRTYRSQSLQLRGETRVTPGATHVYTSYGWGYPHGYGGVGWAVTDPPRIDREWGVYQGPSRLTVPAFYGAVGQAATQAALNDDIEGAQKKAKIWYTTAGVGAVTMLGTLIASGVTYDRELSNTLVLASWGGAAVTVTGLLAGSGPAAKATRLERSFQTQLTPGDAQAMVDAHNDALRERLGITPDDVWQLERSRR